MKRYDKWTGVLLAAAFISNSVFAQAPQKSEDVILQGFYWDSQQVTGWKQLQGMMDDMAKSFTCVWLPPSAQAEGVTNVGGNNVGYHPRQWNNQNSCWGTAEQLKKLIGDFHQHDIKVIADIVVNHRAGATDWGNFTADDFGDYGSYQLTASHICRNDEMNTDPAAGKWNGMAKGADDTGENWGGARDLDHTSTYVQQDVKAYLAWLKGSFGYDGWRYDFVKGFAPRYVEMYNKASEPYLSVGEYWDGSYDKVAAWIDGTGKQSMAFDFPMKYAALNNGLAKSNYAGMSWIEDNKVWRPAGMIHHHKYNRYAVTFVDNHDTYRDGNKFKGYVEQAYAFLLSSPGVPCIFWPHWRKYQIAIDAQIKARKIAGVHSQSDVVVTAKDKYYESRAQGKNGQLICRIGFAAPKEAPKGYHLAASGSNWWYYLSDNLTGIESVESTASCTLCGNHLSVKSYSPTTIRLVKVDGRTLFETMATDYNTTLSAGCYLVNVGNKVYKIMVK